MQQRFAVSGSVGALDYLYTKYTPTGVSEVLAFSPVAVLTLPLSNFAVHITYYCNGWMTTAVLANCNTEQYR